MPYIDAEDASPPKEVPTKKTANSTSSRNSYASAASTASHAIPASSHQPHSTSASPNKSREHIPRKDRYSHHIGRRRSIEHSPIYFGPFTPIQAPPVLPPPALQTLISFKEPATKPPPPPPQDAMLTRPPVVYRSYRDAAPSPRPGAGSSGSPNRQPRPAKQPPAMPGTSTITFPRPAPFPFTIPTLHAPAPQNRIAGLPDSAPLPPPTVKRPSFSKPPPRVPEPTPRTTPRPPHPPPPSTTPLFPQPPPPPLSSGWGYGHPGPAPTTSPHHTPPMTARQAAFLALAPPRPYTHSPYEHADSSTVYPPQSPSHQHYRHEVASLVGFPPDASPNSPRTCDRSRYRTCDSGWAGGGSGYPIRAPVVVDAAFQPLYRRPEDDVDGIGAMVGLTLEEVLQGWRAPTEGEGTFGEAVWVGDVKKRKREGEDREMKMKTKMKRYN